MRLRATWILVGALCLASTVTWADLSTYSQDFESLDQSSPAGLSDDGWLIFANVFNPDFSYAYGYGVFAAPNGGNGFSALVSGEGGARQGEQQLSVYSDYNNGDHGNGLYIEANVFQEQVIGAADAGSKWRFQYDAKRGNIEGDTVATAFIKVLDPNAGYSLSRFVTIDMTNVPGDWGTYKMFLDITPDLAGQILQIGFFSTTTNYQGSGVFYDKIDFRKKSALLVELETFGANMTSEGVLVSWTTALEIDTVGFRLLRESGAREKTIEVVTPNWIPSSGTEVNGSYYQFVDRSSRLGGEVLYYLEDMDLNGKVTRHGPAVLVRPRDGGSAGPRQR